jgi:hypothetical protein
MYLDKFEHLFLESNFFITKQLWCLWWAGLDTKGGSPLTGGQSSPVGYTTHYTPSAPHTATTISNISLFSQRLSLSAEFPIRFQSELSISLSEGAR